MANNAGIHQAEKSKKPLIRIFLSLDNRGPHKCSGGRVMARHRLSPAPPAEPSSGRSHPLWALLIAQCFGVLNQHAYKMVVSLLAVHEAVHTGAGSATLALVNTVFIVPFLVFAGYAGQAADVCSKRTVLVLTKISEVAIMALGCGALLSRRLDALLLVLALLATQATFFGPARYGLLPEMLPAKALGHANGLVEMGNFVAIVLGAALGTGLFVLWHDHLALVGFCLLALAVAGTVASLRLPPVPPASSGQGWHFNPWSDIGHGLQRLWQERVLWLSVMGMTFFWCLAALLHMAVLLFGKESMGLDDLRVGLLSTFLALGMGAGSLIAGRLSGLKAELGLVPLGAFGMGLGMIGFALLASSYVLAALALVVLGLAGGWFIVPLQTFLQYKTRVEERGLFLATASFLSMAAVLGAAGLLWVSRDLLQWPVDRLILWTGVVTLLSTGYVLYLVPAFLMRLLCWMLTHTLYRIRVVGAEHIPTQGPALLVCNHVSYVDALLVAACVPRFIRFLIYRPIYEFRAMRWLFRLMQAIPVSGGPRAATALARARQSLHEGHVVCIFAEGAISRTGNLLPFKRGFERIVQGLEVPIIPLHLDRLWGSIFSFQGGRFLWKWPALTPYPVTVSLGAPLPSSATASQVRQVIMELGSAAMRYRASSQETLPRRFIRTAKRHWSAFCMADSTGAQLTYGEALIQSVHCARWLQKQAPQARLVAVLLPPSVAAALANLAVLLAG
ncbi:MAG: MFS transporter, partial [Candidatus Tectomicrobia bacterium]|nr:MFS transporter [Candidatus Tectomicrobia bacterium]